MMITFIVLFLPAVLSVWLWEVFAKTQLTKRKWVYLLSLNILLINFGCFAVKKWILYTGNNVMATLMADMTPSVAVNYLIMAIPAAVALALVEKLVSGKIQLRVEGDDKNASENENP